MSRGRRRCTGGAGEAARQRHAWLELLQTSGPFLTLPVADRVFPDGLPLVPAPARAGVRAVMAELLAGRGAIRHAVIELVLRELLDWDSHHSGEPPDALAAVVVEHGTTVRPDFAFVVTEAGDDIADSEEDEAEPDDDEPSDDAAAPEAPTSPYRLLGMVSPWGTHPLARTTERGWTASAAERLAVLLRARDVPIGLVTDGRWWALVWAPPGGATGVAVWDGSLFSEEPDSLRAFTALLGRARFLGVPRVDTLPALLAESTEKQEELTEQLGEQVRDAVELLLGTLDRLDAESEGALLYGVDDDELYAGVVTVMMRIIFVLFAEERRLLPSDDERYAAAYSVGGLVEDLRSRAALAGERSLEHRTGAWHRLLALARAIHGGVAHEDLRLPAYGGGLFDPDRHPWLEGRGPDGTRRPPRVDDRTVLRMLLAVQYVEIDGESRRLSFRALGVEQIGYVYEGLLELEVRTADEVTLGLERHAKWPRSSEPCEVGVSEVREWVDAVPPAVAAQVKARTGWSPSRVERALRDAIDEHLLTDALGGDRDLLGVLRTIGPVLRRDERLRPVVTLPGRRYIAPGRRRASTGTHYTPPQLASEVAIGALEPLVYRPGPLETADRSAWQPRPSEELLGLRVADIAMGSGAFLVAACRYLADRLVEAWTAEGEAEALREAAAGVRAGADAEASPVVLRARRRIAEKCLYGVDINPLAVEMGKLSLWLVTMDRERPFGFLNDRFVTGDSLLGLVSMEQLDTLHVDPVAGRRLHSEFIADFTGDWRPLLGRAADVRRTITARPVQEIRDVEHKQRLLRQAEGLTRTLTAVADAITGVGLAHAGAGARQTDAEFLGLSFRLGNRVGEDEDRLRLEANADLQAGRPPGLAPRTPLHWPLAFPEVLVDRPDPGFDAIIGNPPFSGGRKISGASGNDYLAWLQRWDGGGTKGETDLSARFVLRAQRLLNARGQLGYVATNTLVQGKTLVVGLMQAVDRGFTLRRGRSSHPWPGRANLEIVDMWASRAPVSAAGELMLDGELVPSIGPDLEPVGRVAGRPRPLRENEDTAFIGSFVLGTGFVLAPEQAVELIELDGRNADALQPFVIGKDLNQRPDCSASRWIINFRDWSLERAVTYPDLIDIVRQRVKPSRDRLPDYKKRVRDGWWRYEHQAPTLYASVADLDHMLAIARVSSSLAAVRVPTGPVYSEKCVLFAVDDFAMLAVLLSSVHTCWAVRYTSTMRTDINYSPSDVFLTLPRPRSTPELTELGKRLDTERRELMLGRGWGLTTTYNHVHSPADRDPAIVNLREVHTAIDHAVLDAYGWDLDPEIGHHPTKIGTRWTVSPRARFELLDLLLEENHRRHAKEQP